MHVRAGACREQESVSDFPGAGIIGSYELLDMGAGNGTQALWKDSMHT